MSGGVWSHPHPNSRLPALRGGRNSQERAFLVALSPSPRRVPPERGSWDRLGCLSRELPALCARVCRVLNTWGASLGPLDNWSLWEGGSQARFSRSPGVPNCKVPSGFHGPTGPTGLPKRWTLPQALAPTLLARLGLSQKLPEAATGSPRSRRLQYQQREVAERRAPVCKPCEVPSELG